MGSRDRRMTRNWIYSLLRIGNNLQRIDFSTRLAVAIYLSYDSQDIFANEILQEFLPFPFDPVPDSLEDRLAVVMNHFPDFSIENIFPFHQSLSSEINAAEYAKSMLSQPDVWIRYKRQFREHVLSELTSRQIVHSEFDSLDHCLRIPAGTSLEKLESFEKGYFEIQDINSQRSGNYFKPFDGETWWDACCGSGGKSLLLAEIKPDVKIFATDKRPSILESYRRRSAKAGLKSAGLRVLDVETQAEGRENFFDGIIADVPCSGSGTWARSPEWLSRFSEDQIAQTYSKKQRSIVANLVPALKQGAPLIYITCSVFREENEENVGFFLASFPLDLKEHGYLHGYANGADTLFVARMEKRKEIQG